MTRLNGLTVNDIGDHLLWSDFRDFITFTKLDSTSALYKSMNPQNWWWQPEFDFYAGIMHALEVDIWRNSDPQRRGAFPTRITKPIVRAKEPASAEELAAIRARLRR